MKDKKQITEEERQELIDLHYKETAVNDLLSKCLYKQETVCREKDEWFNNIRGKYDLPEDAGVSINHEDGSITVKEKEADPKK